MSVLVDSDPIAPERVRHAFGHFATGVTVVTTRASDGAPVGTTASAVSALSLSPPLLLVCLERSSHTLAAIRSHGAFAINVLAEGQEHLSANFARRGAAAAWEHFGHRHGHNGSPVIDDVHAVLNCRLERCVDGGDHEIVIGLLVRFEPGTGDQGPLLHYRGNYAGLKPT